MIMPYDQGLLLSTYPKYPEPLSRSVDYVLTMLDMFKMIPKMPGRNIRQKLDLKLAPADVVGV